RLDGGVCSCARRQSNRLDDYGVVALAFRRGLHGSLARPSIVQFCADTRALYVCRYRSTSPERLPVLFDAARRRNSPGFRLWRPTPAAVVSRSLPSSRPHVHRLLDILRRRKALIADGGSMCDSSAVSRPSWPERTSAPISVRAARSHAARRQ